MWSWIFDRLLASQFKYGILVVTMPDGQTHTYGDGTGEPIKVTIKDPSVARKMFMNPDLALGEAYTDGTLVVENDDIRGLMASAIINTGQTGVVWWEKPAEFFRIIARRWTQIAPTRKARMNVSHHYDLSADLYELFLDEDRQYSCAYFTEPDMSLDDAQRAKKALIAGKLKLEPGMTVLDIGCGWGGLGLTLARDYGAKVVGVTLSEEQHKIAVERAKAEGLSHLAEFRLMDYRDVTETFDRIVSVGMFEHVGVPHYREYFRNVSDRLKPDGIAMIHTIGRTRPPGATSPWILKYIFPGGYVPSLSEMTNAFEKEWLYPTDIEIWRMHYAETLRHWFIRFQENKDKARELYDERFCRMWQYYLAGCEMTFRHGRQAVFQVQLAHDQEAVPLTRDYLYPDKSDQLRHAAE
jgi:cyclopropane-fatty-acyl-phospholipid synthase